MVIPMTELATPTTATHIIVEYGMSFGDDDDPDINIV
jgi:hypothetical protein